MMTRHFGYILSKAMVLVALCCPIQSLADRTDVLTQSIVNGTREPREIYLAPAEQLAIGWLAMYGTPTNPQCTGTLISSRVVITAKHCTEQFRATELIFGMGVDPGNPTMLIDIESKDEHPTADVTLLYLSEDAMDKLDGQNFGAGGLEASLIPIPHNKQTLIGSDRDELIERRVEVVGYGNTQDQTRFGRYFARVTLTGIDDRYVTVNGNGDAGVCDGDSGGPVLTVNLRGKPVILGVLFGGSATCTGEDYFTRLDQIRQWIDNGLRKTWISYPQGSPCRDLTFLGRCVDTTVEWCNERMQLQRLDCPDNTHCVFVDHQSGYYCDAADFCASDALHCDTRYDGFLPSGPAAVALSGGCHMAPGTAYDGSLFVISLGVFMLLGTRRRRGSD